MLISVWDAVLIRYFRLWCCFQAAKVASEKQTEALKALQSAAKVSGDQVESAQPAAEEPIKVEKSAAQEPANGTHVEDAAPQSAAVSAKMLGVDIICAHITLYFLSFLLQFSLRIPDWTKKCRLQGTC